MAGVFREEEVDEKAVGRRNVISRDQCSPVPAVGRSTVALRSSFRLVCRILGGDGYGDEKIRGGIYIGAMFRPQGPNPQSPACRGFRLGSAPHHWQVIYLSNHPLPQFKYSRLALSENLLLHLPTHFSYIPHSARNRPIAITYRTEPSSGGHTPSHHSRV